MLFFGGKPRAEWASATNVGTRAVNEDCLAALERDGRALFVVCDGLGGHGMGQEAARLATDVFEEEFREKSGAEFGLAAAFDRAQEAVLGAQARLGLANQMKTTATALYYDGARFSYGHVGDTRLYLYRRGRLRARTLDHSVSQMLVFSGALKDSEIRSHPDRSRLLRVLGDKWDSPKYEMSGPRAARRGMGFLICTDGLWEFVGDPRPETGQDAQAWLGAVLARFGAESKGKDEIDNYSAIAVLMR